jgi:hypothetical protein
VDVSAEQDAIVYLYENVSVLEVAYWGIYTLEFVPSDKRAAFVYLYENVT